MTDTQSGWEPSTWQYTVLGKICYMLFEGGKTTHPPTHTHPSEKVSFYTTECLVRGVCGKGYQCLYGNSFLTQDQCETSYCSQKNTLQQGYNCNGSANSQTHTSATSNNVECATQNSLFFWTWYLHRFIKQMNHEDQKQMADLCPNNNSSNNHHPMTPQAPPLSLPILGNVWCHTYQCSYLLQGTPPNLDWQH